MLQSFCDGDGWPRPTLSGDIVQPWCQRPTAHEHLDALDLGGGLVPVANDNSPHVSTKPLEQVVEHQQGPSGLASAVYFILTNKSGCAQAGQCPLRFVDGAGCQVNDSAE